MSFLKNIGNEETGDNVGACIMQIIQEVKKLRNEFLKKHNITMEDVQNDMPKYRRLWKEWLKENKWL